MHACITKEEQCKFGLVSHHFIFLSNRLKWPNDKYPHIMKSPIVGLMVLLDEKTYYKQGWEAKTRAKWHWSIVIGKKPILSHFLGRYNN